MGQKEADGAVSQRRRRKLVRCAVRPPSGGAIASTPGTAGTQGVYHCEKL